MIGKEYKSVLEVMEAFSDRKSCIDYLEKVRWNGNVKSPFDANSKVYKCKDDKYYCVSTNKYFNVLTGSMLENTKLSLTKWMVAVWLLSSSKKGISSYQLSRDIGVTQKTAWFPVMIRNNEMILGLLFRKHDVIKAIKDTNIATAPKLITSFAPSASNAAPTDPNNMVNNPPRKPIAPPETPKTIAAIRISLYILFHQRPLAIITTSKRQVVPHSLKASPNATYTQRTTRYLLFMSRVLEFWRFLNDGLFFYECKDTKKMNTTVKLYINT
jgi:hypothetical protein